MLQSADQVVSMAKTVSARYTSGTFHDEQRASWCSVYVGCVGIPATSAGDAGPGSHGHALELKRRLHVAAFCTSCRDSVVDLGGPVKTELP